MLLSYSTSIISSSTCRTTDQLKKNLNHQTYTPYGGDTINKEEKLLVIIISTLITLLPFNSIITAQHQSEDPEKLYEIRVNLFGREEYSLFVTKDTLNEIERIINETSKKLSQVNGGYLDGLPIVLDEIRHLWELKLFPNLSYKELQYTFQQSINKQEFTKKYLNLQQEKSRNIIGNGNVSINFLCFVAGYTDYATFHSLYPLILEYIFDYELFKFFYPILNYILLPLSLLYYFLIVLTWYTPISDLLFAIPFEILFLKSHFLPVHIANYLDLGLIAPSNHGWVCILGLGGLQIINGTFVGGVAGFTGIGLWSLEYPGKAWFIGFGKKSAFVYLHD